MLFTTAVFAFLYLPVVLLGFYWIGKRSTRGAAAWLFAASLFFYGYWMPQYVLLLLGSIVANFFFGSRIAAARANSDAGRKLSRDWLALGVFFNLALLGYFKYADFFIANLNALLQTDFAQPGVILPIGISFFTFTQIAFLADAHQKGVREYQPTHYGLFVTYFPHLVAGPVLHHAQMMPQFAQRETYQLQHGNFAAGLAILCIGLFKKIVVADGMAPYADAAFGGADALANLTVLEAWIGALSYTFQLYFDFSGYSDMAVGLSWMLNIRLPYNFNSPYRATNISDFWRRWHITLSNFLRDYLYIPLGGNRRGPSRRYVNLAITMVLGGLWHGANWTFVIWGALHGAYLGIHHAFRAALPSGLAGPLARRVGRFVAWLLTFAAVVLAWVFFRAESIKGAWLMLERMIGQGVRHTEPLILANAGLSLTRGLVACIFLTAVTALLPNSNRIGEQIRAGCTMSRSVSGFTVGFAALLTILLIIVNESRDSISAFIYFNF
ncbi:MAG: MBOAT family protein [Pseudomonadales bacterium]|nr:MBOAT family protein [Pseudomonadales bacterium]